MDKTSSSSSNKKFDITVAILGHVSVGKTTILNALFQEKFSEVSAKRTTAGINHFRVSSLKTKSAKRSKTNNVDVAATVSSDDESTTAAAAPKTVVPAEDTLTQITADNANLRTTNTIQEKVFDIALDEPILQDLRQDTQLVIVEVPGINEARTEKVYRDYVERAWETFDAVIVVMDARQGVNTEEQVGLLDFVKKNLDSQRVIPVIVLCNKVDDPDDDELMALVDEARTEVERVFGVGNREAALASILGRQDDATTYDGSASPAFVHASAENAFLYRSASRLAVSQLKRLDRVYLDKIGHEEIGKFKWKKLSDEEKYTLIHGVVSDPVQYKERLESSNFDKVLKLLDYFLGGKEQQEKIIEQQLQIILSKISLKEGRITGPLTAVFDRSVEIRTDASALVEAKFWALFEESRKQAFDSLRENPATVAKLGILVKELVDYAQGLYKSIHPTGSDEKIVDSMKAIVAEQMKLILEKESTWTPLYLPPSNPSPTDEDLRDWHWSEEESSWYRGDTEQMLHLPQNVHPSDFYAESWVWLSVASGGTGGGAGAGGKNVRKVRSIERKKRSSSKSAPVEVEGAGVWTNQYSDLQVPGNKDENPAERSCATLSSWSHMSSKDWFSVVKSMLLPCHGNAMAKAFSREIVELEWVACHGAFSKPDDYCFVCKTTSSNCVKPLQEYRRYMDGSYQEGKFTPLDNAKYQRAVQIQVPDGISDPAHWGHVAWLFCQYMDSRNDVTNG